jgi:hypothetical protein
MNAGNETEHLWNVFAIGVWENEGGALDSVALDRQYGRREPDRSWTVYHVFTGVPAHANGQIMTGLSRSEATDGMLSLNRSNDGIMKNRGSLTARVRAEQPNAAPARAVDRGTAYR